MTSAVKVLGKNYVVPICLEEQARYVGVDNTFTSFADTATYCFETDGGAGPTIEISQNPQGGWTDQFLNEWVPNTTFSATNAGVKWILEAAFVNPSNPSDISGSGSGLPGVLTAAIAQQFVDNAMSWRFLQITVCPGSPTPTRFYRKASAIYGDVERNLLITPTQLGPFREFRVCEVCTKRGVASDWYVRNDAPPPDPDRLEPFTWDLITDSGQIPKCAVPCGTIAASPSPTNPTCTFQLVKGCDSGVPDPGANAQNSLEINGIYEYCDGVVRLRFTQDVIGPDGIGVAVDHTLVGSFVDCDTGEVIVTPPPDCDDFEVAEMWKIENKTPGITNREWSNLGPANTFGSDPTPIEAYLATFDFSVAPTTSTVVTANTFALNDTDNTASVLDYQRRDGYICVDEPTEIEFGTNSEGYIGVWIGLCGREQKRVISYAKSVGLERTPRYVIPAGIHSVRLDNVDWGGSNSNWTLYQVVGGVAGANNSLFDSVVSTTRPVETCKKIKVCKPSGFLIDLLTDALVDKADCRPCKLPECAPEAVEPPLPFAVCTAWRTTGGGLADTMRRREWTDLGAAPAEVSLAASLSIIGGFDGLEGGVPLPAAPADTDVVAATTLDINDSNNTGGVLDLEIKQGFVLVAEPFFVRYLMTGSERYNAIYVDKCCGGVAERIYHASIDAGAPGVQGDAYGVMPAGIHHMTLYNLDTNGTNASGTFQWSSDGVNWSADESAAPWTRHSAKPVDSCFKVRIDDAGVTDAVTGDAVDVTTLRYCALPCEATAGGATADGSAAVVSERDVTPHLMNFTSEGDVEQLRDAAGALFPAGTMGRLIAIEDIGTGFVRWSIDGSVPTTQEGPSFTTTGPYHAAYNLDNVDLSLVRLDGSNANSSYSVAFVVYN